MSFIRKSVINSNTGAGIRETITSDSNTHELLKEAVIELKKLTFHMEMLNEVKISDEEIEEVFE